MCPAPTHVKTPRLSAIYQREADDSNCPVSGAANTGCGRPLSQVARGAKVDVTLGCNIEKKLTTRLHILWAHGSGRGAVDRGWVYGAFCAELA